MFCVCARVFRQLFFQYSRRKDAKISFKLPCVRAGIIRLFTVLLTIVFMNFIFTADCSFLDVFLNIRMVSVFTASLSELAII